MQTQAREKAEHARRPVVQTRVVGGVIAMISAVTAVSVYTFWRMDRVQENVGAVNQFYVPVLKHLNLLNGKWSAYQRAFEQSVGFRKWGTSAAERNPPQMRLRKMVEANLVELSRRVEQAAAHHAIPEGTALRAWIDRLAELADREPATLAEIASLVKAKRFAEAATAYARARQEHLTIGQGLATLSRDVENRLALLQLSTEQELRSSQSVMLLLLGASLLFSLVVLFRLRRWLLPIVEWTRVAQEIALKGTHRDVRFPRITRSMPPEISLLTREFTRMGTTVLERERTIQQQNQKLESLNEHLKEQNEMLRKLGGLNERILNSMSSGLLVISSDGTVEQFNGRYCELFKTPRSEVYGRSARDVLAKWPVSLVDSWLAAQEPLYLRRLSFEGHTLDVRVQQLHAQAGRLLLFEDVGDLVEAEKKLEHARKLVLAGDLSSQVAHEVRNPLNSMSLQLEMLAEDVEGSGDHVRARVVAIEEQVRRLERITERYLDVRRVVSRRKEAVDLHAQIEKCLGFLSAEIQAARIRVELRLEAKARLVEGDADAISQVFFNLLRNAIEALREIPEPRVLAVETVFTKEAATVRFNDNGPGVKSELKTRLFEPFVTDKAAGHGLGLSVSRQICIEHGGELRNLEAEQGASFELSLPLGKSEEAHAQNPDC